MSVFESMDTTNYFETDILRSRGKETSDFTLCTVIPTCDIMSMHLKVSVA